MFKLEGHTNTQPVVETLPELSELKSSFTINYESSR